MRAPIMELPSTGGRSKMRKLARPHIYHSGNRGSKLINVCECGKERRGPEGGVCGKCGGAIPTKEENATLN